MNHKSVRRIFRVLCLLLVLALAACRDAAPPVCEDALGCVDIAPGAPLKLGVIQSLSGDVASLGQEQLRGLELALARRGGSVLAGRKVVLAIEDTGCAPEGGANAALKIVADPSRGRHLRHHLFRRARPRRRRSCPAPVWS